MGGWCWASLIPSLEQFPSQLHNSIRMAEEGAQGRKWAVGTGLWWGRRALKATSADTAAKRNVHWITAQWHVQPNPVEVLSVRDIILLSSPMCFDVIYSAPVCLAALCHSGKHGVVGAEKRNGWCWMVETPNQGQTAAKKVLVTTWSPM